MADPDAAYVQVQTTIDSREGAAKIARSAVEARLAACAQVIGPVASTYRWEGHVQTEEEWLVVLKTTAARFEALATHIRGEHSYETPEIIATPIVAGDDAYLRWVSAEAQSATPPAPTRRSGRDRAGQPSSR